MRDLEQEEEREKRTGRGGGWRDKERESDVGRGEEEGGGDLRLFSGVLRRLPRVSGQQRTGPARGPVGNHSLQTNEV